MSKIVQYPQARKWWEELEKIEEFKKRVAGLKVRFTMENSSGSIGVVRDFIIQCFPGGERLPTLIVDFPNSPYTKFTLDSLEIIGDESLPKVKDLGLAIIKGGSYVKNNTICAISR